MSGEDHSVAEGNGLGGSRGGIVVVEGVEVGAGVAIVDVDLVGEGGVEEVTVDC